jgi:hypothetical protein
MPGEAAEDRVVNLADFDPDIVAACHITEHDLQNVVRYITILQGRESQVLNDLAAGGYYGTSVLLHEVVELRILLARDPLLLRKRKRAIGLFLKENADAHIEGLMAEYSYLRRKIAYVFDEIVGVGELVQANASTEDFKMFFDSEWQMPVFEPTEEQVKRASNLLTRLKGLGKEMNW